MSALLEIDGLGVDLPVDGEMQPIVRDVKLEIGPGEIVGLVGESGAGKSMTGRAVARLLPAAARTSGSIRFEGKDVLAMGAADLRSYRSAGIGMIFQDPRAAINPVRRIDDFLTEALLENTTKSKGEAREEVSGLLRRVGITDPERRLRQYPAELSGGLLQRVMIASVLAMRPKLVIADEPTTALDATTQAEVVRILLELQEQFGLAMLLITHDLELASAVCSRTAVMYAGGVVESQPSKSLHEDPLHPYSAALVTSRPSFEQRLDRLPVISGRSLAAYEAPDGCPFADRCSHVQEGCRVETPQLRPVGPGEAACLRAEELRHRVWPAVVGAGGVAGG